MEHAEVSGYQIFLAVQGVPMVMNTNRNSGRFCSRKLQPAMRAPIRSKNESGSRSWLLYMECSSAS